jgi:predicted nuclease with TOPRIM domain
MEMKKEENPGVSGRGSNVVMASPDDCGSCPSNEILTHDEEGILSELREIKETVRPLAKRLKVLEGRIKDPSRPVSDSARNEEAKLEGQMARLRHEWEQWEIKLDEAIEQKLICLGHHQAPA